ncbi:MAG: hypothetical protein WDN00_03120 [Limisphaerales bacterium]
MRKLGYILLIFGFLWVTFVAVEVVPVAHAIAVDDILKKPRQESYTWDEIAAVSTTSKYRVAHFAMFGFVGGLLMFVGGIILDKSRRSDSAPTMKDL